MSKKYDTSKIENDLKRSPYFSPPEGNADTATSTPSPEKETQTLPQKPSPSSERTSLAAEGRAKEPEESLSELPSSSPERDGAALASLHASMLASIRGVVRKIGKESVYVRVTPEEKVRLSDIVYTLKREGVRTTENEVSRIALNYLIEDYKLNGERSMLAQVIEALQA